MSTRVFLLDDHELVLRGLRDLLDGQDGFEVVGEASTAAEALRRVEALAPDIALLDVRLGENGLDGVEVCREIRSRLPGCRCLMLTSFAAITAGASGYVLKGIHGQELVEAVQRVAAGQSLLDPAVTAAVLERIRRGPPDDPTVSELTEQERNILDGLADGLTNREIAERLFLAEKTVKNYVSSLLAKMGMSTRTQAAVYAARQDERRRRS